MPKVRIGVPQRQREIEDDLRARYGGAMTAKDVGVELGMKHPNTYNGWLADVPAIVVNNRKKWRVADVAGKIYQNTEEAS